MAELTSEQLAIVSSPLNSKLFLSGPASCGKTTSGVERLRFLLQNGVPGNSILMLTPQRTLQEPYFDLLTSPQRGPGGEVTPATVGGLARRMVDLFWPLAAEAAGVARPDQPPVFLTLETAQYYMAHIVRPLLEEGFFESVTIDRNRLYSQILDNLNKAAAIGFPHTEIGARLDSAYFGEPAQRRVYADAQECANRFRQYCLDHNLLDFSLQLELFWNILWPEPLVRDYLTKNYRHLIYDNVEEDIPRAHDLLRDWLPEFDSALLINDEDGGFRRFLGADVETASALRDLCDETVRLDQSFVSSAGIADLSHALTEAIAPDSDLLATPFVPVEDEPVTEPAYSLPNNFAPGGVLAAEESTPKGHGGGSNLRTTAYSFLTARFYPELLEGVANQTYSLITETQIPASEIVILAPYLNDALRFAITNRLQERGIPWRTHRPSRSLHDEPASHALLTLAALAHPQWDVRPPRFDMAYAFMSAIDGLDLVRAQLLTEIVYRQRDFALAPFDGIKSEVQERITFIFGNRYAQLRDWLLEYRESDPVPLDHFLRKLFGEVLSQPGFGFHTNFDSVRVAASLVESVKKFRQALEAAESPDVGREYVAMLTEGVIAAQYLEGWQAEDKDAVLVAPAHTFLMMNRPVTVQFWLDPGSSGWYERLSQPLTQPYVLSRTWERREPGQVWSDADEVNASRESMARLTSGLLRRCRSRVYLALSDVGESGFESRGELLKAFQQVLQAQVVE